LRGKPHLSTRQYPHRPSMGGQGRA
jgi:hypothetical protein